MMMKSENFTMSYEGHLFPLPTMSSAGHMRCLSFNSLLQGHEGTVKGFCLFVLSVKQTVNLNSVQENAGCWLQAMLVQERLATRGL